MSTKITDAPSVAGIKCPKKTGEMDKDTSCHKCPHYAICLSTFMDFMEAMASSTEAEG